MYITLFNHQNKANNLFLPQTHNLSTIFKLKKLTITKITQDWSRCFPFVGRCLSRAIRAKWRTPLSLAPTRHSLDATCQSTPAMYQLNTKTLNEINFYCSRNKVPNCISRSSKMIPYVNRRKLQVSHLALEFKPNPNLTSFTFDC